MSHIIPCLQVISAEILSVNFFTHIREAVLLTFNFLRANKLRSFLSVLGITIGIFCIVAILTATHSLEQNIRSNVDKMGDNIVYIQKWPWGFGGSYQWWDYMNRPEASIQEYKRISEEGNKELIKETAFFFEFGNNTVKSKIEEISGVKATAVIGDFFEINKWDIIYGRSFTNFENAKGKNVAILGYNIALNLYHGDNPLGKDIKLNGSKITVIGILAKQGNSIGGQQHDDVVVLPGMYATRFAKPNTRGVSSSIVIKGIDEVELKQVDVEVTRIMRSIRKLKPKDKDNFAINKLTMFSESLNQTFGVIDLVAVVIGLFSLLVGGFGIANIMFVSVKERTSIIGLQKSLGAKRSFIMSQFLIEAIFLCIVGALIGIVIVIGLGLAASKFTEFKIFFSTSIFLSGIGISIFIGLVAGLAPARKAARMDPVVAIRK